MVMPRFVQWALKGEPIQVYGDGGAAALLRQAVTDVVRAIIWLSRRSSGRSTSARSEINDMSH